MALRIRALFAWTVRMGISRRATWIAPSGFARNAACQPSGFRLHERTKTRPSTITTQRRVKRCAIPARTPKLLPAPILASTSSEKRLLAAIRASGRDGCRLGEISEAILQIAVSIGKDARESRIGRNLFGAAADPFETYNRASCAEGEP